MRTLKQIIGFFTSEEAIWTRAANRNYRFLLATHPLRSFLWDED